MPTPLSPNIGSWIGTNVIPNTPSPIPWPSVVTTTSAQVIGASNPSRIILYFYNASNTNTIWLCPALTHTNSAVTAAANGPGSIAIQALSGFSIEGSALQAWNACTETGTAALTIWEFMGK